MKKLFNILLAAASVLLMLKTMNVFVGLAGIYFLRRFEQA